MKNWIIFTFLLLTACSKQNSEIQTKKAFVESAPTTEVATDDEALALAVGDLHLGSYPLNPNEVNDGIVQLKYILTNNSVKKGSVFAELNSPNFRIDTSNTSCSINSAGYIKVIPSISCFIAINFDSNKSSPGILSSILRIKDLVNKDYSIEIPVVIVNNFVNDTAPPSSSICKVNYHLEQRKCTSNIKQCSGTELSDLSATSAYKEWGSTQYGACIPTSCISGYDYDTQTKTCKNTLSSLFAEDVSIGQNPYEKTQWINKLDHIMITFKGQDADAVNQSGKSYYTNFYQSNNCSGSIDIDGTPTDTQLKQGGFFSGWRKYNTWENTLSYFYAHLLVFATKIIPGLDFPVEFDLSFQMARSIENQDGINENQIEQKSNCLTTKVKYNPAYRLEILNQEFMGDPVGWKHTADGSKFDSSYKINIKCQPGARVFLTGWIHPQYQSSKLCPMTADPIVSFYLNENHDTNYPFNSTDLSSSQSPLSVLSFSAPFNPAVHPNSKFFEVYATQEFTDPTFGFIRLVDYRRLAHTVVPEAEVPLPPVVVTPNPPTYTDPGGVILDPEVPVDIGSAFRICLNFPQPISFGADNCMIGTNNEIFPIDPTTAYDATTVCFTQTVTNETLDAGSFTNFCKAPNTGIIIPPPVSQPTNPLVINRPSTIDQIQIHTDMGFSLNPYSHPLSTGDYIYSYVIFNDQVKNDTDLQDSFVMVKLCKNYLANVAQINDGDVASNISNIKTKNTQARRNCSNYDERKLSFYKLRYPNQAVFRYKINTNDTAQDLDFALGIKYSSFESPSGLIKNINNVPFENWATSASGTKYTVRMLGNCLVTENSPFGKIRNECSLSNPNIIVAKILGIEWRATMIESNTGTKLLLNYNNNLLYKFNPANNFYSPIINNVKIGEWMTSDDTGLYSYGTDILVNKLYNPGDYYLFSDLSVILPDQRTKVVYEVLGDPDYIINPAASHSDRAPIPMDLNTFNADKAINSSWDWQQYISADSKWFRQYGEAVPQGEGTYIRPDSSNFYCHSYRNEIMHDDAKLTNCEQNGFVQNGSNKPSSNFNPSWPSTNQFSFAYHKFPKFSPGFKANHLTQNYNVYNNTGAYAFHPWNYRVNKNYFSIDGFEYYEDAYYSEQSFPADDDHFRIFTTAFYHHPQSYKFIKYLSDGDMMLHNGDMYNFHIELKDPGTSNYQDYLFYMNEYNYDYKINKNFSLNPNSFFGRNSQNRPLVRDTNNQLYIVHWDSTRSDRLLPVKNVLGNHVETTKHFNIGYIVDDLFFGYFYTPANGSDGMDTYTDKPYGSRLYCKIDSPEIQWAVGPNNANLEYSFGINYDQRLDVEEIEGVFPNCKIKTCKDKNGQSQIPSEDGLSCVLE